MEVIKCKDSLDPQNFYTFQNFRLARIDHDDGEQVVDNEKKGFVTKGPISGGLVCEIHRTQETQVLSIILSPAKVFINLK